MVAKPNVMLFTDTNEVRYNFVKLGVYIQHINGELFTADQWETDGFSNDEANGVAIIDENCSFVMAKDDIGDIRWSLPDSGAIEGIIMTTERTEAAKDFEGRKNTELIIAATTESAALGCVNYIFPNGAKGYLASAGEWLAASKRWGEVKSALLACGGSEGYYNRWSSTMYDSGNAWFNNSATNGLGNANRYNPYTVRAFTELILP